MLWYNIYMAKQKKLNSETQTRSLDASGFYSDCQKKDMLYAALIRSPVETVKITGINIPDLPEDYYFYTANDIPGEKTLKLDEVEARIFGYDRISYVGEPVGIIIGPDQHIVDKLSKDAEIKFDIGTMESALKQVMKTNQKKIEQEIVDDSDKKSVDILDDITDSINEMPSLDTVYDKKNFVPVFDQKIAHRELKTGLFTDKEIDEVYEELKTDDDIIVAGKWDEKISNPYWQETNGAFAYMENDILQVYVPTKWTYHVYKTISDVLNIPADKIYVHKTISSETKSSGLWRTTQLAAQVAIAAYHSNRPVKLVLSHEEEDSFFVAGVKTKFNYRSLVSKSTGVIKAMEVHINIDVGSANPFAQEITDRMAIASCNYYKPQNLYINAFAHTSKNPPTSLSIKSVDSQAFFAIENHMEQIASQVQIPLPEECSEEELKKILATTKNQKDIQYFKVMEDSAAYKYVVLDKRNFDVRLINAAPTNFPLKLDLGNISEAIYTVKDQSDYDRKNTAFRGDAETRMNKNEQSFFALPLRGIGLATAYNNSGYLGERTIPFDPKLEVTLTANNNVEIHARKPSDSIKNIWRNIVAQTLQLKSENNKDIIEINSDFSINDIPKTPEDANNFISIMNDLLRKCCNDIKKKHFQQPLPIVAKKTMGKTSKRVWDNDTFAGNPFYSTGFAAAVVEVELDLYTYSEKIKNIWVTLDCGEILDEAAARKTISLEIQQELASLVAGKTVTCDNFHITFIKSKRKPCQLNKLIHNTIPAAFSSALSLALTTNLTTIPCTEKKLFKLVQDLNKPQIVPAISQKTLDGTEIEKDDKVEPENNDIVDSNENVEKNDNIDSIKEELNTEAKQVEGEIKDDN